MKRIYFVAHVMLALLVFSCEKDCPDHHTGACLAEDPINEIGWLTNLKNSITNCACQTSVMQGTYRFHRTVFFVLMNDPLCNGSGNIALYDCEGKLIKVTDDIAEFGDNVTIDKVLYTCEE